MQKAAIFIDGANLYATCKATNLMVDYKRLLKYFNAKYFVLRSYYYTALIDNGSVDKESNFRSIQPLIDYMAYNGYLLVTKRAKEYTNEVTGVRKTKGNMDVELVIDAVEIAKKIEVMILFSGDGDFRRMVEYVQRKGVYVICVSSLKPQPMIADELRRQVDAYVELGDIAAHICKA